MAARWMESKLAKLKRDRMRDSRGTFERFKDEPSRHIARNHPGDGFYVTPKGSCKRGLPGTIGPFATEAEARDFCRRGHISDYDLRERVTVKRSEDLRIERKNGDKAERDALVADHQRKLQAQRELSRAIREAQGHRTAWAR